MQLKLKNLKPTKSVFIFLFFSNIFFLLGQGKSILELERIKVDGVSAVVGDYVILDSDIDRAIVEMESQGMSTKNISRCELLGKLMEDKLYAHHATQDSLEIRAQFEINNNIPKTCIIINIEEIFMHCAKALMRSSFWDHSKYLSQTEFRTISKIINDQLNSEDDEQNHEQEDKRYKKQIIEFG